MKRFRRPRSLTAIILGLFALAACKSETSEPPKKPVVPEVRAEKATPTKPPIEPVVLPTPTAKAPEAEPTSSPEVREPEAEPAAAPEADKVTGGETELELIGIIRAAGQSPSVVIEYRGSQEIFRKGDPVFDQGMLRDVREDAVVIRSGNKDVTLEIRRAVAEAPPTPEARVVELRKPAEIEAAPPPLTKAIPRADVRTAMQSLEKVLGEAEAERVALGGGHGLQLKTVGAMSFFAKLGLKSGDILQKLNGVLMDDLKNFPDLSGAADRAELTVSFVRNDIGLTFSRPIQ